MPRRTGGMCCPHSMLRVKLGEGNNLMRKYVIPNMRLGATSFLLHETYVPAVRFAAERCDDVALLLVEPGERNEYLATPGEIAEIGRIIAGERATLHVHLPTDADFDTWEGARSMIGKIRRVAELTGPLDPHSFVLHVDFPSLHGTGGEPSAEQQEWTAEALREIAACLPAPERLAVENLRPLVLGSLACGHAILPLP